LAKKTVADGEGVTKVVQIVVEGARTASEAEKAIRAVANSPLVKTAFFGEDANWGRILCAAGYSGVPWTPTGWIFFSTMSRWSDRGRESARRQRPRPRQS